MLTSELVESDRLVLDTHVWVWTSGEADGPERIEAEALTAIERAARNRQLFVSAASVWEIALKAERGVVLLAGDLYTWVREQQTYPGVRMLSMNARIATEWTRLPSWIREPDGKQHRDPCDRFLVATARLRNAVLLTCDREIHAYARHGHVRAYDAGR